MQTERFKFRLYCGDCNDFTVHSTIFIDEIDNELRNNYDFGDKNNIKYCETCKKKHVPLSDNDLLTIDENVLIKQQQRFIQYRKDQVRDMYSEFVDNANPLKMIATIMKPVFVKTTIIESDAGLLKREEEIKIARQKEFMLMKQEIAKYKYVGRNDKCLCGSNLKYKKCHEPIHNLYR